MASKVDICNLALSHIGQSVTIQAIEPPDGTVAAEHCAKHYALARDMTLELHEWTFATTRATLVAIDMPSHITQWRYAYAMPNGVIRALAVLRPGAVNDTQGEQYRIEVDDLTDDQILLTNCAEATLKYIRRVDDPTRYTPTFVYAMSWLLAHFVAGPLTKKTSVVESCFKTWQQHMRIAAGVNAQSTDESAYKNHVPEHIRTRDGLQNISSQVNDWQPFPAPSQS